MKPTDAFQIGIIVGAVLGSVVAVSLANDHYQKKAITNGTAFYHETSGEFTWKDGK